MTFITTAWEWLHSQPSLAKFALGMAIIVGIPPALSPCPASGGSGLVAQRSRAGPSCPWAFRRTRAHRGFLC